MKKSVVYLLTIVIVLGTLSGCSVNRYKSKEFSIIHM
jgi:hypothetical protein